MTTVHARFARGTLALVTLTMLLALAALPGTRALAQTPEDTPNADATSILELAWPNGVDLLAGHELTLDKPQYEWRVSTLTAESDPGKPIATGPGVLIAVEGPIHVLDEAGALVRLDAGAAMATMNGRKITVSADGEEPVRFILIELITSEQAERVVTSDTLELVGPVRVPATGDYAMVLLNLPVAVTIDMSPDEVIAGAIRPAVSIAHIGNVVPEDLGTARNYDRWIVALYPLAESRPAASPSATTPPQPTAVPVIPTRVPVQPTATVTPTATATATATSQPTSTTAPTATSVPDQHADHRADAGANEHGDDGAHAGPDRDPDRPADRRAHRCPDCGADDASNRRPHRGSDRGR